MTYFASEQMVAPRTPEWVRYFNQRLPGETPHPDDVFFNGFGGGTDIDHGIGTFDVSESLGALSMRLEGGTDLEEIYGRAWPLTPSSAPVTIETCAQILPGHTIAAGYGFAFGFADGATTSSNIAGKLLRIEAVGGGAETWNLTGTFDTAIRANGVNDHYLDISHRQFFRAAWASADTFQFAVSCFPDLFSTQIWVDLSTTLTPTHFWVGIVTNQSNQMVGTFDYVRVADADLIE